MRFLIVGTHRSGSNWLASALDSHPDISCAREELLDHPYLTDHPDFAADPWNGLERMWQSAAAERKIFGFRVFYFHVWDYYQEHRAIWDRLRADRSIRIVQLTRLNLLALVVSWKKARLTNQWHIADQRDRRGASRVEFDATELRETFEQIESGVARVSDLFADHPRLSLTYEALFDDTSASIHDIEDFLGVRRLPLQGEYLKLETEALADTVDNFEELRHAFAGTRYEPFFLS